MANASFITFTEGPPSSITAPPSGSGAILVDTNNHLNTLGSAGQIWIPSLQSSMATASAAINTTETVLATLTVPLGLVQVGGVFRWKLAATCTSTAANVATYTLRCGTTGTTSDASCATWTTTAATSGTNNPFTIEADYVIRTLGAPGTGYGIYQFINQNAVGASTVSVFAAIPASNTGPVTTTATKWSITYVTAATTTTSTFQTASVEYLPV